MANLCYFEIRAIGTKESIEEFVKVFNYDEGSDEDGYYLARTEIHEIICEELPDGNCKATVCGDCAWSVHSCMRDGAFTYYGDRKYADAHITTLDILSKELNLTIEVYSEECGFEFMEHFLIRNGVAEIEDCLDYEELDVSDELSYESTDDELSEWLEEHIDTFKHYGMEHITIPSLRSLLAECDYSYLVFRESDWDFSI